MWFSTRPPREWREFADGVHAGHEAAFLFRLSREAFSAFRIRRRTVRSISFTVTVSNCSSNALSASRQISLTNSPTTIGTTSSHEVGCRGRMSGSGDTASYALRSVISSGLRARTLPPPTPRLEVISPALLSLLWTRRTTTGLVPYVRAISSDVKGPPPRAVRKPSMCNAMGKSLFMIICITFSYK